MGYKSGYGDTDHCVMYHGYCSKAKQESNVDLTMIYQLLLDIKANINLVAQGQATIEHESTTLSNIGNNQITIAPDNTILIIIIIFLFSRFDGFGLFGEEAKLGNEGSKDQIKAMLEKYVAEKMMK